MAETKMIVKDLGEVTAYAYAVSKGYTGTEEEFATLMASYATVGQQAVDAKDAAVTARNEAEAAKNESVAAKDEAVQAAGDAAKDAKDIIDQILSDVRDNIEQIDQNTLDIADLKETTEDLEDRKANIDGSYPDMTVGNAEQLNSSKFVENSEPYTLRTSGGSADIGNREYVDAVVGGTLAWNQAVRDEASENSTDFADIVTVTDAVEDAAGVKVKLEPVQDLRGYDHPWPAGGGSNIWGGSKLAEDISNTSIAVVWNKTAKTITIPIHANPSGISDESIVFTNGIVFEENTVYTLITDGTASSFLNMMFKYTDGTTDRSLGRNVTVGAFSSASGKTVQNIVYRSYSGSTVLNYEQCGLFKGSVSVSAYTPYSNICPITGWDGVKVTRTGKNLLPMQAYKGLGYNAAVGAQFNPTPADHNYVDNGDGTFTISNLASWEQCCLMIPTPVAGNYYVSLTIDGGPTFCISKVNTKDIVVSVPTYLANPLPSSFTIARTETITEPGYLLLYIGSHSTEITITNPICQYDEQITAYEPYAGQTYEVSLPTEAGTVYGGELTVNADGSGSLVVDRIADTLTGQENMGVVDVYYAVATSHTHPTWTAANVLCSHFAQSGTNSVASGNASTNVWFRLDKTVTDFATVEAFRTYIAAQYTAGTPVMILYKLATPITYTLTASQIRTLLGTNNVWADTGDLALTYTGTDEHLTLESGKKYLTRISGTDSMLLGSGQEITAVKGKDNVFDLTKMFGSAVADYVYGQGALFFRKWFPNAVYPYNAGELKHVEGLQSHDMVGFNAWDEEMELGYYDINTGEKKATSSQARSKNPIPVLPNTRYFATSSKGLWGLFYDGDGNLIEGWSATSTTAGNASLIYGSQSIDGFLTPPNAASLSFYAVTEYGTTYKHDICISIAHNGSRKGEYEPYEKHSYPLDSTVVLRGIPKVDANGVYWDGDRYLFDGTVERRYGVVDLGTLNWEKNATQNVYTTSELIGIVKEPSTYLDLPDVICGKYDTASHLTLWSERTDKTISVIWAESSSHGGVWVRDESYTDAAALKAAMQGVLLVYKLATPTTETAQPYHSTQWVSDWGTEEFVSTGIVPIGTETRYPANLRDKLQHLPDAASGNGSYLITQTDGQMVLTPFPAPPSTAGNYVLKATVTNGVATYTWEVST